MWDLYGRRGVTHYSFLINYEVRHKPKAEWSPRLAEMVADGTLRTSIGVQETWTDVARVGQGPPGRRFTV